MKWLIIGTGTISEVFIQGLRATNEIPYAILSRSLTKAQNFAQTHRLQKAHDNLEEALLEVDAVYVATPNAYHYDFAKIAIKAQKNVIVEKIMTDSYHKTQTLFELARKYHVKIVEAYAHIHNRHYQNLKIAPKAKIELNFMALSSKIKNQTYCEASTFKKETFGGVVPDMGVYPLSLLIWHLGTPQIVKLSACKYLNHVLIETKMDLKFKNNHAIALISKLRDGENHLQINNQILNLTSSGSELKIRFQDLINAFVKHKNLKKAQTVSLAIAKIVEQLKLQLFNSKAPQHQLTNKNRK